MRKTERLRGCKIGFPMKLKLINGNVRGVNDNGKRKIIKAFLRVQKLDIFCLQETKV